MKKIISGEHMTKSFGQATVLQNVSVDIMEGEFVAIMGPSGSGKSTLLFALSGMDTIDSGQVLFDEQNLSQLQDQELADIRRTKMGFVFQQPTMLKNLNIIDNIILPVMRDNRKNVVGVTAEAKALMQRVGIAALEQHNITQVSGGQLQRAGICRALMNKPKVIFGDEPTGALNSKSAQEMMDIFAEINTGGTTVVLVTHDPKVAARTERILYMRDGKIESELKLPKYDETKHDTRMQQVTEHMMALGI